MCETFTPMRVVHQLAKVLGTPTDRDDDVMAATVAAWKKAQGLKVTDWQASYPDSKPVRRAEPTSQLRSSVGVLTHFCVGRLHGLRVRI